MQHNEDEVIQRGLLAESLLHSDDYNHLYETITNDIALEILATPLVDKQYREDLYITFNGMRAFAQRLTQYANAKKAIEDRRNAENTEEQDIDY